MKSLFVTESNPLLNLMISSNAIYSPEYNRFVKSAGKLFSYHNRLKMTKSSKPKIINNHRYNELNIFL